MKIIVIAGIKRSGSTWLFNIVREYCESVSQNVSCTGQRYILDNESEYKIIKVHPYDRYLANEADIILTSDRSDEGIRASLHRAFGGDVKQARIDKLRKSLDLWNKDAKYCLKFTDIYDRPLQIVDLIGGILDIDTDPKEILDRVNSLKPPEDSRRDPETFLFSNHITIEGRHE